MIIKPNYLKEFAYAILHAQYVFPVLLVTSFLLFGIDKTKEYALGNYISLILVAIALKWGDLYIYGKIEVCNEKIIGFGRGSSHPIEIPLYLAVLERTGKSGIYKFCGYSYVIFSPERDKYISVPFRDKETINYIRDIISTAAA